MKKLIATLFMIAGMVSCSDNGNDISIKNSDNMIAISGTTNEFDTYGSSRYSNTSPNSGGDYDGLYYNYFYISGNLDGKQIRIYLDIYSTTAEAFTGTSTYNTAASGNHFVSDVELRIYETSGTEYYYANSGTVKIEKLTGTIYRVTFNMTLANSGETITKTLSGAFVDSFTEGND
jgi:hypothetical protein